MAVIFDMAAHVSAIRSVLTSVGVTSYWVQVDADKPSFPYVLVWGPPNGLGSEQTLGCTNAVAVPLRFTLVAENPLVLLDFVKRVQGALKGARISPQGWSSSLTYLSSSDVMFDEAVTVSATKRHPAYVVDSYRLAATPA